MKRYIRQYGILAGIILSTPLFAAAGNDTTETIQDTYEYKGKKVNCFFVRPLAAGKKPAVFFIQGFGCTSIINAGPYNSYRMLSDSFAKNGFVVMCSEKPGMENNTAGCKELDFNEEVAGFKAAYAKLLTMPDVDTGRIIIFGHSMGGIEAPYIASGFSPKGIIVYGVTVKSWYEYLLDMLRFQNPHLGVDYVTVDKEMQRYPQLLMDILINGKSPAEAVKADTSVRHLLVRDFLYKGGDDFNGKHIRFSQTLQKVNHVEAWKNIRAKVLSVYAEYDIQTAGDFSHREITDIVNFYHPGNARYLNLPKTDHSMIALDDPQQAYDILFNRDLFIAKRKPGLNPLFFKASLDWINSVLR